MSPQAITASASRWTKVVPTLGLVIAGATAAIGLAAPASADSGAYLQSLQPIYAFMSESELMSAGNTVCGATHSGKPASDIVPMLVKEYGLSASASYEIVVASVNYLGC